jgi:hypothetical protein
MRTAMRSLSLCLSLLAGVGSSLAGCSKTETALVVIFDSDLFIPSQLDALAVDVRRDGKLLAA